jgi:putative ABC transport system permease protein
MAAIYKLEPGSALTLPLVQRDVPVRVLGVWRDYARQFGAIAIDATVYRELTGDARINDLALWLQKGAEPAQVMRDIRSLGATEVPLELAGSAQIRAVSLTIFDRSFAVTRYLQVVAIAIGLIGIAASLSAQVLARRKEFGLLAHLGLTRKQVLMIVGGESAAWLAAGCLLGLTLGIAVSVVLVHVVNPQSFHWTMDLLVPWGSLLALSAAVLVLGVAASAWSARQATGRAAVIAVKEDW